MRRSLPTAMILLVMALVGVMYWVDLSYYTDAAGFVTRGPLWARMCAGALPVLMGVLGLRTVGPRGVAALRVKSRALGCVFALSAAVGFFWGALRLVSSAARRDVFGIVLGALAVWYGVWMLLAALQLWRQAGPSPTVSAVWGVAAALPYCFVMVQRILMRPSGLYRVGPLVRALSPMVAMLWFVMILRSFYIALPRRRVRRLYILGVLAFMFCTCLELPLAVHGAMFGSTPVQDLPESAGLAALGIAAGCVSAALAGQSGGGAGRDGEARL